jgi:hypothetical protein
MRAIPFLGLAIFLSLVGCAQNQPVDINGQSHVGRFSDLDEDYAPSPDLVVRSMDYLAAGAGKVFSFIADGPVSIWDFFNREKPSQAARQMENQNSPDDRRNGINELVSRDFAKRPPYTDRYRQISLLDSDPIVRATAIRALNRSRDQASVGVWQQALSDSSPLVRLEAAKALVHIPNPDAAPTLAHLLDDKNEDREVRIAAADALQNYRTLPTARMLSVALAERDFGIAWQSRRSLRILTGRDYGYDQAAWLDYFTGPEKPFQ